MHYDMSLIIFYFIYIYRYILLYIYNLHVRGCLHLCLKSIPTVKNASMTLATIAIASSMQTELSGEKTEGRGNEAWHVIHSPPSWASYGCVFGNTIGMACIP